MIARMLVSATAAISLIAVPAVAQNIDLEQSGHHYQGGPKTVVPHHMGKKDTVGETRQKALGRHHFRGGTGTSGLHYTGDKKTR